MDTGCSGDYAQVEADDTRILLEANEWDPRFNGYHTVTLFLTMDEARSLAGEMARAVLELELRYSQANSA